MCAQAEPAKDPPPCATCKHVDKNPIANPDEWECVRPTYQPVTGKHIPAKLLCGDERRWVPADPEACRREGRFWEPG